MVNCELCDVLHNAKLAHSSVTVEFDVTSASLVIWAKGYTDKLATHFSTVLNTLGQLDWTSKDSFSRCMQELRHDLECRAYWGFEPDNSLLSEKDMLVRTLCTHAIE